MKIEEFEAITRELNRKRLPAPVKKAISAALDKQAERIVVLKLKGINDITDYMIICHGHSTRQNGAIADEVQRLLGKEMKLKPFSVEGEREAEWILIDYIDFIVHIFTADNRAKYALEKLWMDAKRYNFYLDQES